MKIIIEDKTGFITTFKNVSDFHEVGDEILIEFNRFEPVTIKSDNIESMELLPDA